MAKNIKELKVQLKAEKALEKAVGFSPAVGIKIKKLQTQINKKQKLGNSSLDCKCGTETPKRNFNFCVCKTTNGKGKLFLDAIRIKSVKYS